MSTDVYLVLVNESYVNKICMPLMLNFSVPKVTKNNMNFNN